MANPAMRRAVAEDPVLRRLPHYKRSLQSRKDLGGLRMTHSVTRSAQ
jgi:hypothetical protein